MIRHDNLYSRLVAWMKIILPLAALALLSTLFLISRTVDPTRQPTAEIDLERRAMEQGATGPRFTGVTPEGDEVAIAAQSARPDPGNPQRLIAENIAAELSLTTGNELSITARRASMDQRNLTATLTEMVELTTTDGYRLSTGELVLHYDRLLAETPGPVTGTGPPGEISAGKMRLSQAPGQDGAELLFTGGVKLVYRPAETKD